MLDTGFILDPHNTIFNQAVELVMSTDRNIFLTGKAGTGKTTFLKHIVGITRKNAVVLAPTGVAAINAGGVTIHSFFRIPFGPFAPNDPRLRIKPDPGDKDKSTIYDHFRYKHSFKEILAGLELLIIDEASMVRCDVLDVIDKLLRVFTGRNKNLPFGGVQVILIGDAYQLPPVATDDIWTVLGHFYESPFFFSARAFEESAFLNIELQQIYRQKDLDFINLLNKVRDNNLGRADYEILNKRCYPGFNPPAKENYITLATHNFIVDDINSRKLAELPGELYEFEGEVTGDFPDNMLPAGEIIELKVGTQVMVLKNDPETFKKYFNGKIGTVVGLEEGIMVEFPDGIGVDIKKAKWENVRYKWNKKEKRIEKEVIGTFTQYPLRLAWAITVHKSQGLTFGKVIADLSRSFTPGQVYVALSRCSAFDGLVLQSRIDSNCVITDPNVIKFSKKITPDTLIMQELNTGKADQYYKRSREAFRQGDIGAAMDNLQQARQLRDDTHTAVFSRYITAHLTRLRDALKRASHLTDKIEEYEEKICELEETLAALEIENSGQDDTITALKTKQAALNKEVADNGKKVEQLAKSLSDKEKENGLLATQITLLDVELTNMKAENERLRGLKWYQRW